MVVRSLHAFNGRNSISRNAVEGSGFLLFIYFFTFLQYTTRAFSEKISNRTTLRHHLHGKNLRRAVSVSLLSFLNDILFIQPVIH